MPQRIRLSRAKGWRMPPDTVKVDRSTPWGNPFVLGEHGTREQCVAMCRELLATGQLHRGSGNLDAQRAWLAHVHAHLQDLRGKNLACWCSLDGPCHADALLEAAAQ